VRRLAPWAFAGVAAAGGALGVLSALGFVVVAGSPARHERVLSELLRVDGGQVRAGAGVLLDQVRDAEAATLQGAPAPAAAGLFFLAGRLVAAVPPAGLARVAGAAEAFVVGHPDSFQLV
jgi:hypothetical protein